MFKRASKFIQHGRRLSADVYHLEPRTRKRRQAGAMSPESKRASSDPLSPATHAALATIRKIRMLSQQCAVFAAADATKKSRLAKILANSWAKVTARLGDTAHRDPIEKEYIEIYERCRATAHEAKCIVDASLPGGPTR